MESYDVVNAELKSLRGRLATERQALEKLRTEYDASCVLVLDDEEAVASAATIAQRIEIASARVRGLEVIISEREKLLKELQAKRDNEIVADITKKAEVDLEQKRIRLTEAVRVARERVDQAKAALPAAIDHEADARFALAERTLQKHNDLELDPYATKEEVRKHQELGVRLVASRDKARAESNAAADAHSAAQMTYLKACEEFAHAANVLRWNCPPRPEDRPVGEPAFSAVQ